MEYPQRMKSLNRTVVVVLLLLLLAGFTSLPTPVSAHSKGHLDGALVTFSDVTNISGLNVVDSGPLTNWASYGPGVSMDDCDGDGDLDVFITARYDHLSYESGVYQTGQTQLMLNDGDGTYTDWTVGSGLGFENTTALGAAWADYDNDGDVDVYISMFGQSNISDLQSGEPNKLMRNRGDCTFEDVTSTAGVANSGHSATAVWADYDHDGWVDLYSMNLGIVDEETYEIRAETNILYRNNGDGTFTDRTKEAGGVSGQIEVSDTPGLHLTSDVYRIDVASPSNPSSAAQILGGTDWRGTGLSWAAVWFDYDADGWEDLYIASDFGMSPIYRNEGDGTFTIVTQDLKMDKAGTGMGTHAGDYDGDGDLDLCHSNFGPNYLWENRADSGFYERAPDVGLNTNRLVNWYCQFFDYDLDGDMDLFFGVGRINKFVTNNNNSLYRNDGDVNGDGVLEFTDVTEIVGMGEYHKTMGAAIGDFDNDGDLDILLGNSDADLQLFRNNAVEETGRHWLKVKLNGTNSNRQGIGCLITVVYEDGHKLSQHVYAGSGFLGTNDPLVHFGLDDDTTVAAVKVRWSNGHVQTIKNVDADQILLITEEEPPQESATSQYLIIGVLIAIIVIAYLLYQKRRG